MHLSFHSTIEDKACHVTLVTMAELHSRIERKLYAAMGAGKFNNGPFKSAFSAEHNLTSRQFNSMAVEVRGKISGVKEALADNVKVLEARLVTLKGVILNLKRMVRTGLDKKGRKLGKVRLAKKALSLHEKKRKVQRIQHALVSMKARIKANVPGICFGSRKLFMQQFLENVVLADWRKEWKARRDSQFLLVGTGEEDGGCAACQATLEEDGTLTLRLRPFNSMFAVRSGPSGKAMGEMMRRKTLTAKASDFVVIRGVKFSHGSDYINAAVVRNQSPDKTQHTPLTWRFLRGENGHWYVHLSLDVPENAVFDKSKGAIGVDFNEGHIAATVVDKHGNFVMARRFELNLYGLSSLQAKDKIRCVARDVVKFAKELGLPIVGEALDFVKKKLSMAGFSAKRARKLSSLHYSAWGNALMSRCLKDGVALRLVNPAYTSLIGCVKFAASIGLSVHNSAARVIARRGMNLSERLPKASVVYPDGVGLHVTLNPVVNTGHRHVWFSWAKVGKTVNAARVAHFSAKTSPAAGHTPKHESDYVIPEFWAGPEGMAHLEVPGEIPGRRPDHPVDGRLSPIGGLTAPMTGITTSNKPMNLAHW